MKLAFVLSWPTHGVLWAWGECGNWFRTNTRNIVLGSKCRCFDSGDITSSTSAEGGLNPKSDYKAHALHLHEIVELKAGHQRLVIRKWLQTKLYGIFCMLSSTAELSTINITTVWWISSMSNCADTHHASFWLLTIDIEKHVCLVQLSLVFWSLLQCVSPLPFEVVGLNISRDAHTSFTSICKHWQAAGLLHYGSLCQSTAPCVRHIDCSLLLLSGQRWVIVCTNYPKHMVICEPAPAFHLAGFFMDSHP